MHGDVSQFRAPGYRTGRMEGFSNGVFSIAVTLLVLEIAVALGPGDDLLGALRDQRASYLGYLVSFATIGAVWWLNLVLLLAVSFLPFPT
jgi:uncharacterized membrane protein